MKLDELWQSRSANRDGFLLTNSNWFPLPLPPSHPDRFGFIPIFRFSQRFESKWNGSNSGATDLRYGFTSARLEIGGKSEQTVDHRCDTAMSQVWQWNPCRLASHSAHWPSPLSDKSNNPNVEGIGGNRFRFPRPLARVESQLKLNKKWTDLVVERGRPRERPIVTQTEASDFIPIVSRWRGSVELFYRHFFYPWCRNNQKASQKQPIWMRSIRVPSAADASSLQREVGKYPSAAARLFAR